MSINGDAWEEEVAQLKARIAELERAVNNECSLRVQATDAAFALSESIARAVVVLKDEALQPSARIRLALEALR